MALRGNLKDFSLPDVFQLVTLSRKSGVLRIRRDDAEGSVWFRDGDVFFAQSNWHREPLGQRMVSAQKITASALQRALEIQHGEGPGGRRLGQVLVDEGYISDTVLEAFVQEKIQDTIFDLMRWDEGQFDFEPLANVGDEDIGLSVSIENVIMEGSRRLEEWNRIRKKVPSMDIVFKMATAPGEGTFEISLKPVEWNLLLLVDGTRSVAELAADTGRTDFDVARIVYGLFSAGLLEVATDEEVERLRAERAQHEARAERLRAAEAPAQAPVVAPVAVEERPPAAPPAPAPAAPRIPTPPPGVRESAHEEVPEFLAGAAETPSAEDVAVFEQMMGAVLETPAQPRPEPAAAPAPPVQQPSAEAPPSPVAPVPEPSVSQPVAPAPQPEPPAIPVPVQEAPMPPAPAVVPPAAPTPTEPPAPRAVEEVMVPEAQAPVIAEVPAPPVPEAVPQPTVPAHEPPAPAMPPAPPAAPEPQGAVPPVESIAAEAADYFEVGDESTVREATAPYEAVSEPLGVVEASGIGSFAEDLSSLLEPVSGEPTAEHAPDQVPSPPLRPVEPVEAFPPPPVSAPAAVVEPEPSPGPDLSDLISSLEEEPVEATRRTSSAGEQLTPERFVDDTPEEVTTVISTDAFLAEFDSPGSSMGLSSGLGDELTALTGGGMAPRRHVTHVNPISDNGEGRVLHRDQLVDRDLVVRIIEGIERL